MPFNKPPGPAQTIPRGERGYILITAFWLLLLGASLVALLMLKNLKNAEDHAFERDQIQSRYAMESAVETVVADILFNGPRSAFAQLPAVTEYEINGVKMAVQVSSENGKIDLNRADAALIERALRGLGIAARPRQAFLDHVREQRKAGRFFRSTIDVEGAMQQAGFAGAGGFCAERYFTVYSGLSQPQANQMDAELARALGQVSSTSNVRTTPGTALRVQVKAAEGLPLVAVIRTSGLIGQSHRVLDWGVRADVGACE
ncbi:MAG: hypothetical protein ABJO01_09940 [Parasphingorhabdus sp.]|uniref:hypothetical protein n=1 Tax=Parasphingorhabdus sp. TaxID=2709688 RepID=UPI003299D38C